MGQRFTTSPHLTKNLTIQIMENKERYYKRKTSIVTPNRTRTYDT